MTWDAPAPMNAAAIPSTRATIPVQSTSVMTVSMTAAMKTRTMTGAAIAAIRTMSDSES
jgi:hypothetical protein